MKTTLALLTAGLIFLATPMLASADGRQNAGERNHYKGWVKHDQYDQRRHNYQRDHRYDQTRNHRVKKQLKREIRETRQELRQVKRQIKRNQRRPYPYYVRPYYAEPTIVIGLPHVVFQFDW